MIKINLLAEGKRPAAVRKTRAVPSGAGDVANLALLGTLVLGVLVAGGWWFWMSRQIAQKERDIQAAEREVKELEAVIKEVESYKAKKADLEHKIALINTLKENQRGPVRIMDEVSRALPELLWLTKMDVTANSVILQGGAFNMSAVANFIDNLDKVEFFAEPILQDYSQRAGARGSSPYYEFKMTVGYNFAPKPTAGGEAGGTQVPTAAAGG
jgi:type IV pilus assembly protein PilN